MIVTLGDMDRERVFSSLLLARHGCRSMAGSEAPASSTNTQAQKIYSRDSQALQVENLATVIS
jgi:hypothetical protein